MSKTVQTVDEWIDQDPPEQLAFTFDFAGVEDDDVTAIKARTLEIRERVRMVQGATLDIGDCLRDVKRRLDWGKFDEWLKAETPFSRDTADRLIAVKELADNSPQFAENIDRFSKSAQYLLVAPSTPETAKTEMLHRGASGEAVTRSIAHAIVEEHKQPQPGTCRVCGCTLTTPCVIDETTGETCAWTDETETLCTRCFLGEEVLSTTPEAEVVATGRTRTDLLSVLKSDAMQIEDLVTIGFSPSVIDRAVEERLIDRTLRGKCSYVWTVDDVVKFVTEQGSVSRLQFERAGCQIGAIMDAERDGVITKQSGMWSIPTTGRKAGVEPRKMDLAAQPSSAPGGNVRPAPNVEELLKGRTLTVSFTFGVLPGKVISGVRVGNDPLATANVTLEASKVRGFPDAVQELISKQLAAAVKADKNARTGSAQKSANIKSSAAKKPASKRLVNKGKYTGLTAKQIAAKKASETKRQAKRKPAAKKGAKR